MKRVNFLFLIMTLIGMSLIASSMAKEPETVPKKSENLGKEKVLIEPFGKEVIYGKASYYNEDWNGRTTANMEIFDSNLLTCASPNLPFNTLLEVTNLSNNKTVIIRVNDRGPYKMDKNGKVLKPLIPHPKRVLDLSKQAFKVLSDLDVGVINIKYEIVG